MNNLIRICGFSIKNSQYFVNSKLPLASKPFFELKHYSSNNNNNNNNDDDKLSQSVEDQIKQIQKNEDSFFGNVKKSFDSLQSNRTNETLDEKRSRLLYQSRKRGTSENGLLLGNYYSR
jgi:hypothetical protein